MSSMGFQIPEREPNWVDEVRASFQAADEKYAAMERERDQLRDLLRRIVADRYMFNVEDDGTGEIGIDSYVSLNAADVALIQALDDEEQA